jgi:hypothetical protein
MDKVACTTARQNFFEKLRRAKAGNNADSSRHSRGKTELRCLERLIASFFIANANRAVEFVVKDFAVADLSGGG